MHNPSKRKRFAKSIHERKNYEIVLPLLNLTTEETNEGSHGLLFDDEKIKDGVKIELGEEFCDETRSCRV